MSSISFIYKAISFLTPLLFTLPLNAMNMQIGSFEFTGDDKYYEWSRGGGAYLPLMR